MNDSIEIGDDVGGNIKVSEKKKIVEIIDKDIAIYYENEIDDSHNILVLKSGKNIKKINLKGEMNKEYKPEIILSDFNRDGRDEIIICTIEELNGEIYSQAYILEGRTLNKISILNPFNVLSDNVFCEIQKENNVFTIGGQYFSINDFIDNVDNIYNKIMYENNVKYAINNKKLSAVLSAKIAPKITVGDIIIEYSFSNNEFKNKNIKFEKNTKYYKESAESIIVRSFHGEFTSDENKKIIIENLSRINWAKFCGVTDIACGKELIAWLDSLANKNREVILAIMNAAKSLDERLINEYSQLLRNIFEENRNEFIKCYGELSEENIQKINACIEGELDIRHIQINN